MQNLKENISARFHQWFDIPYKLHVTTVGQGPPIVMLHGIATSSASWNSLTALLSPHFKCITIDLLGFGRSPKPHWYSYTPHEHIRSIDYTIKKLGLKKPFTLLGHSMGSLLALHYTAAYPNNISHLMMLSPPVYLNSIEMEKAKRVWREVLYSRAYRYLRTHKKFTLNGARGLKTLMLRNNPFLITDETWLSFSKSLEECIEKQNVVKELEHIACPTDVFYGSLDQLLIKTNIQELKKHASLNLHSVRARHMVNARYAQAVAQTLLYNESIK